MLELRNTHRDFGKHNRKNLYYAFYTNNDGEVSLNAGEGLHKVFPQWDDGFEGCWTWDKNKAEKDIDLLASKKVNGHWKIYRKSYASGADRMLKTILIDKLFYTERGQKEFNKLFDTKAKLFQSPKSPYLLAQIFQTVTTHDDLIVDFFTGSGTTGHAAMKQNATDGESRRYILVQLPEPLDPENKDQKTAADFCDQLGKPRTIAELTKERLRCAGAKIKADNPLFAGDTGFRVFKLDTSNIRACNPDRDNLAQTLFDHQEHLLPGRTEADILYELLLKLGIDLCIAIEKRRIAGKDVRAIGGGRLLACLSEHISTDDAEALAQGIIAWHKALSPAADTTCVFRDSVFADDVAKTNLAAILAQHGIGNVRSL